MHHKIITLSLTALALCGGMLHAQKIDDLPAIAGSAVDKTNDKIIVRDASANAAAGNLRLMSLADLVNVPSLFSSYEPPLGNPASNGYVLSSTTGGVRSWIAAPATDLTAGPVRSTAGTSSIADAALTIAKTSGLQGELDGKSPLAGSASLTTIGTLSSGTVPVARVSGLGTAATTASTAYATAAQGTLAGTALQPSAHLAGFGNLITQASTTGDFPISVIIIGDSFSALSGFSQFGRGARICGSYRCDAASGGGDTGVTTPALDYTKVPDGLYRSIAAGGNLTCAHLGNGTAGPATHVYYTLLPGTGTAQFEYSDNGGAWTAVGSSIDTTAITTVQVGEISLGAYRSLARCRVVASGGTVNGYIGQGVDGPGITTMRFDTAGQGIWQSATVAEANWKAMIAGYKKTSAGGGQLVWCVFADDRFSESATSAWPTIGTPVWDANGPAQRLFDWSRAQNSTVDWFLVGPHPVDPANVNAVTPLRDAAFTGIGIGQNTQARLVDGAQAQREFAVRNSSGFVDCLPLFPDYAKAVAEGYYADAIHLNGKGQDYKRAWVYSNSHVGYLFGADAYRSAIRIGDSALVATSDGRTSGVGTLASMTADCRLMLPMTASEFRSPLSTRSETDGMGFKAIAGSTAVIFGYTAGGPVGLHEFYGTSLRPITTNTGQLGDQSKVFKKLYTQTVHTGYRLTTANFPVSAASEWGGIHTLNCTGTGPYTITLPLAYNAENDAYGNPGREIVVCNNTSLAVTINTSDGLQKIDTATSLVLTTGQKVRLMSAQTSGSSPLNYGNWITLP